MRPGSLVPGPPVGGDIMMRPCLSGLGKSAGFTDATSKVSDLSTVCPGMQTAKRTRLTVRVLLRIACLLRCYTHCAAKLRSGIRGLNRGCADNCVCRFFPICVFLLANRERS